MFDWFRKKAPEAPSHPAPLNLRLGGAVELDLLPFQVMGDALQVSLPEGVQMIEAFGLVELGGGATLCRFYTCLLYTSPSPRDS